MICSVISEQVAVPDAATRTAAPTLLAQTFTLAPDADSSRIPHKPQTAHAHTRSAGRLHRRRRAQVDAASHAAYALRALDELDAARRAEAEAARASDGGQALADLFGSESTRAEAERAAAAETASRRQLAAQLRATEIFRVAQCNAAFNPRQSSLEQVTVGPELRALGRAPASRGGGGENVAPRLPRRWRGKCSGGAGGCSRAGAT
eukprot:2944124-Prymnesium_polylepis.1